MSVDKIHIKDITIDAESIAHIPDVKLENCILIGEAKFKKIHCKNVTAERIVGETVVVFQSKVANIDASICTVILTNDIKVNAKILFIRESSGVFTSEYVNSVGTRGAIKCDRYVSASVPEAEVHCQSATVYLSSCDLKHLHADTVVANVHRAGDYELMLSDKTKNITVNGTRTQRVRCAIAKLVDCDTY